MNSKRSDFPCPGILRGGRSTFRSEMRELAEQSIINERPFSTTAKPGDLTREQRRKANLEHCKREAARKRNRRRSP